MAATRVKVPEKMLKFAIDAVSVEPPPFDRYRVFAEAVLRYLVEHPPVPTRAQMRAMCRRLGLLEIEHWSDKEVRKIMAEWLRIVFIGAEEKVPHRITDEEIEQLPYMYRGMARLSQQMHDAGIYTYEQFQERLRQIEAGRASQGK